jgi:hypothetical protein
MVMDSERHAQPRARTARRPGPAGLAACEPGERLSAPALNQTFGAI